ncbi:OmpH family outer membrane protein [Pseudomonas sp. GX19020]|uniref:OmpH family outer membrane protein n=1 Tax=Pseudomonas sp. GX19020 TaxID=2942277 RepID=UPI00201A1E09|nr:OmpH family outer membrane protein [Pseudomonas sp. GX19020]MCL4065300.1 OmpH family outer membrane protein [Pseudomonas sp. GX19020]
MAAPALRGMMLAGLALLPVCAGAAFAQDAEVPAAPQGAETAPAAAAGDAATGGSGADASGKRETFALLTLNQAELFEKSAWGRAATQAAEQAAAEVSAENRAIEAALEQEERDLTGKRAGMTPEAFSVLARDFDTKVEEFRQSQDAKVRAINRKLDEDRKVFVDLSVPLMAELLDEYGAVAIIGDDVLILSRSSADVTQRAIALMDQRLPAPEAAPADGKGDGQGTEGGADPVPAPVQDPATGTPAPAP